MNNKKRKREQGEEEEKPIDLRTIDLVQSLYGMSWLPMELCVLIYRYATEDNYNEFQRIRIHQCELGANNMKAAKYWNGYWYILCNHSILVLDANNWNVVNTWKWDRLGTPLGMDLLHLENDESFVAVHGDKSWLTLFDLSGTVVKAMFFNDAVKYAFIDAKEMFIDKNNICLYEWLGKIIHVVRVYRSDRTHIMIKPLVQYAGVEQSVGGFKYSFTAIDNIITFLGAGWENHMFTFRLEPLYSTTTLSDEGFIMGKIRTAYYHPVILMGWGFPDVVCAVAQRPTGVLCVLRYSENFSSVVYKGDIESDSRRTLIKIDRSNYPGSTRGWKLAYGNSTLCLMDTVAGILEFYH